ncbi:glycosyltransferase [Parabacteroides sp. AM08-6]|uniref:glycosyltransferase n=1 Tax=Parabacteroides sp. AM08-6 TaxID=2292053 RepID=UPI000F00CCA3|nr:glycosyltransferase [Parabacteroides sp. AM08-6]RHJ85295.1 glycosyltransferase [Parabacteroides sp. AM08-6]
MITASIVTYKTDRRELDTVLRCAVESLIDKIYIVDNSPTDDLKDFATVSSKITYIHSVGNIGYGAAHNIAIERSITDNAVYHIVLNSDIEFKEEVIKKLADYAVTHPEVGQMMPRVVYPDGKLQYLCKLLPTPLDLLGRRFIPIKSLIRKRNQKFEMRASGYNQIMEVPFLSGCFMFLQVRALKEVGLFSSRYWMYCEDIDLCRRISEKYKTIYYPNVTIIHVHKKESFKNKKLLLQHIKSAFAYFNRWGWIIDPYRQKRNKQAESQYRPDR